MKRIFVCFLIAVLMLGMVACTETGNTDTSTNDVSASTNDSDTASTNTNTDTDTESQTTSSEEEKFKGYDENLEHKFIVTDITNHSIVVYDLNKCNGDYQLLKDDKVAIIWEWDADDDPKCKMKPNAGIDSAKYRYSEYYKKDVIIACSSNGWAGVIDYEAKSLLWEYNIGKGPHSIEMLPNGDVVVACSSDPGALVYVPLSAGVTYPVSWIPSLYCHGVSWDPENEWLWVLEDNGVYAATVMNPGKDGKISRLGGTGALFGPGIAGGHAFSPVGGEPGKYWASSGAYLFRFDAETETMTRSFDRASQLTSKNIKGIASFADGTVIQTVAGIGGNDTYGWSSDGFRIITVEMSEGRVKQLITKVTKVVFPASHREFYKVQPFTKSYQ